jgi:hypothetical protein
MEMNGEFQPSRKDKILAFCNASGVAVPKNFDIANPTFRLITIDYSSTPPTLFKCSTYIESEVVEYITSPQNSGKKFRIFDFKRFIELYYLGTGTKLQKGNPIDWRIGVPSNAL